MNRNNYYKQGQSSKVPYIMAVIIIVLLYIMNGMNEEIRDSHKFVEQVLHDFPKDSINPLQKENDSLKSVIEWYRTNQKQKTEKTRPTAKRKEAETKPQEIKEIKPVEKTDTL